MSDLLKQAIADAKAVRATALANARAALQEAFAPQLQSMLATKLQQEVEGVEDELPEEPVVPAAEAPAEEAPVAPEGGEEVAVDLDAAPAEEVPAPEGLEGDSLPPEAASEPVEEVPAEVPAEEELPVAEGGTAASTVVTDVSDVDELTEEKASSDYKKTSKGHKTEDPQGASKELAKGPGKADKQGTSGSLTSKGGSSKASTDYKKTTSGHKTPDPQGASNEFSKGPGKADKNETGKVLEEEEISESTLDEILKELESEVALEDCDNEALGSTSPSGEGEQPVDEEINLEGLFESDDKEEDHKEEEEEVVKENISLKKELQETRNAVQYLRDRINEVNLLNAKLLYTNKLFKQANLTNEQKLKVIEQFDLTKSVREAKLTYANLSESLSFGVKTQAVVKESKAPVKKTGIVKTITEGLASKPVASTKPTKAAVLTEGADLANRFKKLAGIRK